MGLIKYVAVPLAISFFAAGTITANAGQYVVRPGDTVWGIARTHHLTVQRLVRDNNLRNPDRIFPGEKLVINEDAAPVPAAPAAAPAPPAPAPRLSTAEAKSIITAASLRHGVNPNFALAVSYWESNWRQEAISSTGAVGMMQVEPYTAAWVGPQLLHRNVNLRDPYDNADTGVALLRHLLNVFDNPKLALAAYYQGEYGTRRYGIYPSSRSYVEGIWALRNRFQAGG